MNAGRVIAYCGVLVAAIGLSMMLHPEQRLRSADARGILHVTYSSPGGAADAGVDFAEARGFFRAAGIALRRRVVTSVGAQVADATANEVDVSAIRLDPALFAPPSRDAGPRLVGDTFSLRSGSSSMQFIARAPLVGAEEAATLRGLQGRKVAGPRRASIGFYLVNALFQKYGATLAGADYIELVAADVGPALASGAVDAALMVEPFLSRALRSGSGVAVSDFAETAPQDASLAPLVFSDAFAAGRRTATAFMTAYLRGVRAYDATLASEAARAANLDLIAKASGASASAIREAGLPSLDPAQRLDRAFIGRVQDFYLAQGLIDRARDLDKLVDLSFADAARDALRSER